MYECIVIKDGARENRRGFNEIVIGLLTDLLLI